MKKALLAVVLSSLAFASLAEPEVEVIVRAALARELLLMIRPMNEFERRFMSTKENSDALAASQLGDAYMKDEGRVPIEFVRAPTSLDIINGAANLSTQAREDELRKIVNERAVSRGDRMMALGFDPTVGLFFRESLMRHAIEYYRIGEAMQKQSVAENERRILGQQVKRAEGDRLMVIKEYQSKLQPMIDEMQRGGRINLKNDAEKRAFSEEADALEDELDF
ncbi:MAG: hypothetical protein GXP15_12560 [Gammaproteobacteria bacterium]|nr:hypothetical protein [Gammaproteobacteria bacterium]